MKYALDTNLFIDAFRSPGPEALLLEFHSRYASVEYLSAVVALELRAGARTAAAASKLARRVLQPFERRGRVFAPSYPTWTAAGAALAELSSGPGTTSRAFYNDVLIAASCREHGVTLVTHNVRDFVRIRRAMQFDFIAAWP